MTDAPNAEVSPLNALTRKIGPFPGYVYVLAVVGGYVAWRYYKSRHATITQVPNSAANSVVSTDPSSPIASTYTGSGGSSGTVTTPNGMPSVTNNAVWSNQAANLLIAEGYDPSTVSSAMSNYLNGNPLSSQQQSLVNLALTKLGVPPEGVIAPVSTPTPTPTPVPSSNGGTKVELHHIGSDTWDRALVQKYSPHATSAQLDSLVVQTVTDPANAAYRQYHDTHHNSFPANAGIMVHMQA